MTLKSYLISYVLYVLSSFQHGNTLPFPVKPGAGEVPGLDQSPHSNMLAGEEVNAEVSIVINPTDPHNRVIVGHDDFFDTMNTFFTTDNGDTWTPVKLGNADDGYTSTFRFDPTVAFDDDGNVYVGYGVETSTSINRFAVVVCRSTDGGATYPDCPTVYISTSQADREDVPANDKWMLATGPDPIDPNQQNVYIAWTTNVVESGVTDQQIVVSRSTDSGLTYSAPIIINDASIAGSRPGNLFADPAVGPNGELYFCRYRMMEENLGSPM